MPIRLLGLRMARGRRRRSRGKPRPLDYARVVNRKRGGPVLNLARLCASVERRLPTGRHPRRAGQGGSRCLSRKALPLFLTQLVTSLYTKWESAYIIGAAHVLNTLA